MRRIYRAAAAALFALLALPALSQQMGPAPGYVPSSAIVAALGYTPVNIAGDTMTGDLKFTDATYDIGKSGATRPRDLFLSRNLTVGGLATFPTPFTLGAVSVTATGTQLNYLASATGTAGSGTVTLGLGDAWTSFTPGVSCGSGTMTTLGTVSGRYKRVNKLYFVEYDVAITDNGTCGSFLAFTWPDGFTAAGNGASFGGSEIGVSFKYVFGRYSTGTANSLFVFNYDSTYPGATGARIVLAGFLESQ